MQPELWRTQRGYAVSLEGCVLSLPTARNHMCHREPVNFSIFPKKVACVCPSVLGTEPKIPYVSQDLKAWSSCYSPIGPVEATSILEFSRPGCPCHTCHRSGQSEMPKQQGYESQKRNVWILPYFKTDLGVQRRDRPGSPCRLPSDNGAVVCKGPREDQGGLMRFLTRGDKQGSSTNSHHPLHAVTSALQFCVEDSEILQTLLD